MARAVTLLMAVALLLTPLPAKAGGPLDEIKASVDQLLAAVKDKSLEGQARQDKLWSIINQRFNDGEMTRRVMGQNWAKLNQAQKDELIGLFAELLKRSYLSKIEGYSDEEIVYDKERIEDTFAQVDSLVIHRSEKIPLSYRLLKIQDKWWVYDVIIDGVSLVANYRRQFANIIRQEGYDALVRKLKEKKAEEETLEKAG